MASIRRDAQTVDFGTPQTVGVAPDRTSYVQPNYSKFDGSEGRVKVSSDVEVDGLTQMLGAIAPALSKWGENKLDTVRQEAYMSGQAAAAAGSSTSSPGARASRGAASRSAAHAAAVPMRESLQQQTATAKLMR